MVIGDVTIGPGSSVWPGAVLRGDYGTITVGVGSSIQDGTVIHAGPGFPTTIGDHCVVGHLTHLEGCILEDGSLAGSGSVVLHWAVVGHGATVGANAVVPNNMVVPPGALALGVPAKVLEGRSDVPMIQAVGRGVRGQRQAVPGLAAPAGLSYFVLPLPLGADVPPSLVGKTSVPKGTSPLEAAKPRWPSPSLPPVVSPRRSS